MSSQSVHQLLLSLLSSIVVTTGSSIDLATVDLPIIFLLNLLDYLDLLNDLSCDLLFLVSADKIIRTYQ